MSVQGKGREYALLGIKETGTRVRLYGGSASTSPYVTTTVNIVWDDPAFVSGAWTLVSSATNPITWQIEPGNFGGSITITGIEILDGPGDIVLKKAFDAGPYTFTARTLFNLEQILITATNDASIL